MFNLLKLGWPMAYQSAALMNIHLSIRCFTREQFGQIYLIGENSHCFCRCWDSTQNLRIENLLANWDVQKKKKKKKKKCYNSAEKNVILVLSMWNWDVIFLKKITSQNPIDKTEITYFFFWILQWPRLWISANTVDKALNPSYFKIEKIISKIPTDFS